MSPAMTPARYGRANGQKRRTSSRGGTPGAAATTSLSCARGRSRARKRPGREAGSSLLRIAVLLFVTGLGVAGPATRTAPATPAAAPATAVRVAVVGRLGASRDR